MADRNNMKCYVCGKAREPDAFLEVCEKCWKPMKTATCCYCGRFTKDDDLSITDHYGRPLICKRCKEGKT